MKLFCIYKLLTINFQSFLHFFTNLLIINEIYFLHVCYMLFKPLSYTPYIFIYIFKVYRCFLFREGKNKCQYSTETKKPSIYKTYKRVLYNGFYTLTLNIFYNAISLYISLSLF